LFLADLDDDIVALADDIKIFDLKLRAMFGPKVYDPIYFCRV